MIKELRIKNFRSILTSQVKLNRITVIVGANATGKSNLVKSIDFISDLSEFGLQEAIYKRGGFAEILPKQFKNIYDKEISINIRFVTEPPKNWLEFNLDPIYVNYKISFVKTKKTSLKITEEELNINNVLMYSHFKSINNSDTDELSLDLSDQEIQEYKNSEIRIFRNKINNIDFDVNFNVKDYNYFLLLNWFGLGFMHNREKPNQRENSKFIKFILNNQKSNSDKKILPILSSNRTIFGFDTYLAEILNEIQSYGRYDLLINELRQEQSISTEKKVSVSGNNIPSIIKTFIKDNKVGWKRVITTMSNISPYFANVYSESLRAGKEYLIFKEIFDGRSIEAWESSDGTLRALAILVSIENHKNGSTILIEEPEHGLHPWAIKDLMGHVRTVIKEKNLQVILTTHSQQVLESIEKEELLIAERDKNGTKYCSINDIIPNAKISMGEIGELWTRGLLKGVPTSL